MTDQIQNIFESVMHVPVPQTAGNAGSYINV